MKPHLERQLKMGLHPLFLTYKPEPSRLEEGNCKENKVIVFAILRAVKCFFGVFNATSFQDDEKVNAHFLGGQWALD